MMIYDHKTANPPDEGLLAGVGVEVLLELALEAEDLSADLAGVLVVEKHLVETIK